VALVGDSAALMRFRAPLWSSAFRPFFLFDVPFGIFVLMLGRFSAHTGVWAPPPWAGRLWHGHEMLFGFTAAIISGIILTALPSWAGTEEIKYRPLALLFCLWLAGRLAPLGLRRSRCLACAVDRRDRRHCLRYQCRAPAALARLARGRGADRIRHAPRHRLDGPGAGA